MESPWPKYILERACGLLKIKDVDAHEVFYAATTASYVDEDTIEEAFNDDDLIIDDIELVTDHIHQVVLPPGFIVVGVQKIDNTGPELFAVVSNKEETNGNQTVAGEARNR